ncbi:hypothetical protein LOC68_17050 [Blastopirellula sp. JC732]|uniref:Uncharacterized protein n=1 Tax=Blastopirellula sediminis TaxID=2894196 RepID=A0A9X1SH52_9BACT|nr:hypothetical protein [Blastopirellula sediminis]MCC9606600.1 hypothetical protein [Blastopirellula sediminis]MCC9630103.1 hypothetical protein [Blastopirellula sediminis]
MKHAIALIGLLLLALPASGQDLPKDTAPSSTSLRRLSTREQYLYGSLYSGVTRRPAIDQYLLDQGGLDSAGKLPTLPYRRRADATFPNGFPLPAQSPRGYEQPKLGLERYYRSTRPLPRLTATERAEATLYRGPSRPGLIAPRAEANRTVPSWRRGD